MISSSQLSMSRSELKVKSRWLTIAAIALCAAVVGLFFLSMAFHMPGLLVSTFGLSVATAYWIVSILQDGGLAVIDVFFPELIPVIGVIWWYIDEVGTWAAVTY